MEGPSLVPGNGRFEMAAEIGAEAPPRSARFDSEIEDPLSHGDNVHEEPGSSQPSNAIIAEQLKKPDHEEALLAILVLRGRQATAQVLLPDIINRLNSFTQEKFRGQASAILASKMIDTLGEYIPGERNAAEAVKPFLNYPDSSIRFSAATFFNISPDAPRNALEELSSAIEDKDPLVANLAISALRKGNAIYIPVIQKLTEALKDPDLREEAALALGQGGFAASTALKDLERCLNRYSDSAADLAVVGSIGAIASKMAGQVERQVLPWDHRLLSMETKAATRFLESVVKDSHSPMRLRLAASAALKEG